MWLNQDIVAAQEAEVEVIVLSIVAYSPRGRVAYFKIPGYFMGYFMGIKYPIKYPGILWGILFPHCP